MPTTNQIAADRDTCTGRGSGSWRSWLAVFLLVFFLLLAWRRDIIDLPPFEDQACGLWAEAAFLATSNFDYYRLRYEESHFMEFANPLKPGVRSYMVTLLPTTVALLLTFCPSVHSALVIYHLFQFACAGAVCAMLFSLLRQQAGLWGAALCCAAFLTTPLIGVQIDMVGMDLPTTPWALAAAMLVWRGRYSLAAGASTMAFLMKSLGGVLTAATIAYLVILLATEVPTADPDSRRRIRRGLGWNLVALALQVGLFVWGDPMPQLRFDRAIPWPAIFRFPRVCLLYPDVIALLAIAFVASGVVVGHTLRRSDAWPRLASWSSWARRALGVVVRSEPVLVFSWLPIAGLLLAMTYWIAMPRYFTTIMPFLFMILATALYRAPRWRWLVHSSLFVLVVFNLANSSGRFFPDLNRIGGKDFSRDVYIQARNCVLQERSREYLAEHRSCIEAFRILATSHLDEPVLLPVPYFYYALQPLLGYVPRPLKAYNANDFTIAVSTFRDQTFAALQKGAGPGPLLMWDRMGRITLPPPEDGDELIFRGAVAPSMIIYRKQLPVSIKTAHDLEEWYVNQTWPGPWLAQRTEIRLVFLLKSGRLDRAEAEIRRAVHDNPELPALNQELQSVSDRILAPRKARTTMGPPRGITLPVVRRLDHRLAGALESLVPGSSRPGIDSPDSVEANGPQAADRPRSAAYQRGVASLEQRNPNDAMRQFALVIADGSTDDEVALAELALGVVLLRQGQLEAAAEHFTKVTNRSAELPEAWNLLGLVRLQQQRLDEAIHCFQRAVTLGPDDAAAHSNLGLAFARQGKVDLARQHFTLALESDPEDATAWWHLQSLGRTRVP